MAKSLLEIDLDFDDWPQRWMGLPEDIPYGEEIVSIFMPFAEDLLSKGYKDKTVKKHIDNLWLLGGELIREVNMDPDLRNTEALALLLENIGTYGGPIQKRWPFCWKILEHTEDHIAAIWRLMKNSNPLIRLVENYSSFFS